MGMYRLPTSSSERDAQTLVALSQVGEHGLNAFFLILPQSDCLFMDDGRSGVDDGGQRPPCHLGSE